LMKLIYSYTCWYGWISPRTLSYVSLNREWPIPGGFLFLLYFNSIWFHVIEPKLILNNSIKS
jgi:hypothetical protein